MKRTTVGVERTTVGVELTALNAVQNSDAAVNSAYKLAHVIAR